MKLPWKLIKLTLYNNSIHMVHPRIVPRTTFSDKETISTLSYYTKKNIIVKSKGVNIYLAEIENLFH